MTADPCTCDALCPHDVLCSGGHAHYPDSHWWPCCEQGCAGEMHTIHMLKLGGYIAVMAGCGHALVGQELGPLTRQGAAHLRECRDRDEQLRAAGRIQADVIRQAIAAIATLGPISGERWMVELERFAQIVEDEEGSDEH